MAVVAARTSDSLGFGWQFEAKQCIYKEKNKLFFYIQACFTAWTQALPDAKKRDTDGQRDRQTDRHTDRQTDRQIITSRTVLFRPIFTSKVGLLWPILHFCLMAYCVRPRLGLSVGIARTTTPRPRQTDHDRQTTDTMTGILVEASPSGMA